MSYVDDYSDYCGACCDRTLWVIGGRRGPKPPAPEGTMLCGNCCDRLEAAGWTLDNDFIYRPPGR